MHYALRIKKFLYSQYFYGGLRIACGISLPAALMLTVFHERALGFAIAAGALGACQVDMPGPLKHKRNDMLACTLIGSLAALATGLAAYRPLTLWLTVAPLAFMVSMLDVYGAKWPRISFAALMMMVITLSQSLTFKQAWINALCLLGGGLWYTCWSAAVNRWQAGRMEQQAIGESIFAVAEYYGRARASTTPKMIWMSATGTSLPGRSPLWTPRMRRAISYCVICPCCAPAGSTRAGRCCSTFLSIWLICTRWCWRRIPITRRCARRLMMQM